MAQYQITVDGEVLHQLFRGDEGMAKLLESVVNQVLHAQVTEQLKAAPFERSEERLGYRNGYRAREMKSESDVGVAAAVGSQRLVLDGAVRTVSTQ